MRESFLTMDEETAYKQLISDREERDTNAPDGIELGSSVARAGISDAKESMLSAAIAEINTLHAYWPLTVRQIHYRLLNKPPLRHARKPNSTYRNDKKSYGDLCDLLSRARLVNRIPWRAISDETRPVSGTNYCSDAAEFIDRSTQWFLRGYRRDLMQSQQDHFEFVAEKMTVQSIIKRVTDRYCIPLTIGRGYCSLEPRRQIVERYKSSGKDRLILLVASDLDPDGESIAESFARSIRDDFGVDNVVAIKVLLTMDQVDQWKLPANEMTAKETSSRYAAYSKKYGTNAVYEMEAVDPKRMELAISEAIDSVIDRDAFNDEIAIEKKDAVEIAIVKQEVCDFVADLDIGGYDD